MIKRKYKFAFDVKTLKFNNVETQIVFENKIIENNSITKNKKFKQINDEIIQKYIKNFFFNNVNNSTHRKFFLRIC